MGGITGVREREHVLKWERGERQNHAFADLFADSLSFLVCSCNRFCSLLSQQHTVLLEHFYHFRPFHWVRWESGMVFTARTDTFSFVLTRSLAAHGSAVPPLTLLSMPTSQGATGMRECEVLACLYWRFLLCFLNLKQQLLVLLEYPHQLCPIM